ncbi:hypothetical protein [Actibacterium sp. 188UL27-1]|uniref:hypothetical protein n=1 Tax=Actibacterium sp. 188UL27-1 TaxID=2786961 RepID=UPI00195889CA|nr:hypothetical protein [Actibacterium sp. 188UL27-1]MBM7069719.1 hypothetical protein [Actibacterium sp. 188UL27-1]
MSAKTSACVLPDFHDQFQQTFEVCKTVNLMANYCKASQLDLCGFQLGSFEISGSPTVAIITTQAARIPACVIIIVLEFGMDVLFTGEYWNENRTSIPDQDAFLGGFRRTEEPLDITQNFDFGSKNDDHGGSKRWGGEKHSVTIRTGSLSIDVLFGFGSSLDQGADDKSSGVRISRFPANPPIPRLSLKVTPSILVIG